MSPGAGPRAGSRDRRPPARSRPTPCRSAASNGPGPRQLERSQEEHLAEGQPERDAVRPEVCERPPDHGPGARVRAAPPQARPPAPRARARAPRAPPRSLGRLRAPLGHDRPPRHVVQAHLARGALQHLVDAPGEARHLGHREGHHADDPDRPRHGQRGHTEQPRPARYGRAGAERQRGRSGGPEGASHAEDATVPAVILAARADARHRPDAAVNLQVPVAPSLIGARPGIGGRSWRRARARGGSPSRRQPPSSTRPRGRASSTTAAGAGRVAAT